MDDLIKRSDAIELCRKWRDKAHEAKDQDGWWMADNLLRRTKEIPSADAVSKWIPYEERLPEPYCGDVLVTVNDGSVYVDVMAYDSPGDGHTYNSVFYTTDSDGYPNICEDVTAWMPLPKPWKGADDE